MFIMKRINIENINDFIVPIKRRIEMGEESSCFQGGATSDVYIYKDANIQYAYKEYKDIYTLEEKSFEIEAHINDLYGSISFDSYKQMLRFGSFPLALVYSGDRLCGFIMNRMPDSCYFVDDEYNELKEYTLNALFCNIHNHKLEEYKEFVRRLMIAVLFFHANDICMGDVLSAKNLIINSTENDGLHPYFVDTDSMMRGDLYPFESFDSINYEIETGEKRTKKTDIYKLCLIILRLFAATQDDGERASLLPNESGAEESYQCIEKLFGKKFKSLIQNGLEKNPKLRPDITEIIDSLENTSLQEQCEELASKMRPGEDYSFDILHPEDGILITLQGIRKIEKFFAIDSIGNSHNADILDSMTQVLNRRIKERIVIEPSSFKPIEPGLKIGHDNNTPTTIRDAEKVRSLINSIGRVYFTKKSLERINEARAAYDALDSSQRALVQVDKLEEAEAKYEELKKRNESNKKRKLTSIIAAAVVVVLVVSSLVVGGMIPNPLNKSEEASTSSKAVHYYHLDLVQSDGDDYRGSFGTNIWPQISSMNSESQINAASKEFFDRMIADPVLATACIAYVDKEMGTRYTGEFYSTISDDWVNELNSISEGFVSDNELWREKVRFIKNIFDNASVSIEEEKGGYVDSLLMEKGDSHPKLTLGRYRWSKEYTCHYLTYGIVIKEKEIRLSFLIESGFAPVLGDSGEEIRGDNKELNESSGYKGIGLNDPCPCGSGKKYKLCHGMKTELLSEADLEKNG